MKHVFTYIILLFSLVSYGQAEIQAKYPFMHLEENVILIPGDDDKIEQFFDKLDDLAFRGEGEINVLHMGGSHVQAGMLSQAMRENLQRMSPGLKGNRGFFFPFSLAQTNEPRNYSFTSRASWSGYRCSVSSHNAEWGMSGITTETSDLDAVVSLRAYDGDTGRYAFTGIRIFHPNHGTSYFPVIDSARFSVDTIFYDERGFTEFRFKRPYREFTFALSNPDTADKFIWQGVQYLDNWPGLSYHSIGVNGASTKSYLRCDDFEKNIGAIAPDLVVFGIGINDAYMSEESFSPEEFGARYDTLMTILEEANPDVVFLFLTNNDSYYRRRFANPNALAVRDVMMRLAEERDAIVWDLFEVMGGMGSIDLWVDYDLARRDRIHFTREGYELQAQLLSYAIEKAWLNHIKEER